MKKCLENGMHPRGKPLNMGNILKPKHIMFANISIFKKMPHETISIGSTEKT